MCNADVAVDSKVMMKSSCHATTDAFNIYQEANENEIAKKNKAFHYDPRKYAHKDEEEDGVCCIIICYFIVVCNDK